MRASPHLAHTWMWRAHGLLRAGHSREAAALYARAREVFAEAGERRGLGEAEANLGMCVLATGAHGEARACFDRALEIARAIGDSRLEHAVIEGLAGLLLDRGDREAAAGLFVRAFELAERSGEARALASAYLGLASSFHDGGELELARAHAGEAERIARGALDDRLALSAAMRLAGIAQEGGPLPEAETLWRSVVSTARGTGAPDDEATARLGLGGFLLEEVLATGLGDREARRELEAALAAFRGLGDPGGQYAAVARLAVLGSDAALFDEARRLAGDHPQRRAALDVHLGHLDLARSDVASALGRLSVPPDSARTRYAHRLLRSRLPRPIG